MKLIDADVLLSQMDSRYVEKKKIVPDTLAEGFMQMDKLINQQDVFNLSEHDTNLLDKLAEKLKAEMLETYPKNINGVKEPTPFAHFSYRSMCNLLDKVITEMKSKD